MANVLARPRRAPDKFSNLHANERCAASGFAIKFLNYSTVNPGGAAGEWVWDIRGEPGRKLTWQTIATVNEFIRASERFETRQIYAKDMCIKARTCLFAVSLVVSGSIKKYLVFALPYILVPMKICCLLQVGLILCVQFKIFWVWILCVSVIWHSSLVIYQYFVAITASILVFAVGHKLKLKSFSTAFNLCLPLRFSCNNCLEGSFLNIYVFQYRFGFNYLPVLGANGTAVKIDCRCCCFCQISTLYMYINLRQFYSFVIQ